MMGSRRLSETSFYYTHYHIANRLEEFSGSGSLGEWFTSQLCPRFKFLAGPVDFTGNADVGLRPDTVQRRR